MRETSGSVNSRQFDPVLEDSDDVHAGNVTSDGYMGGRSGSSATDDTGEERRERNSRVSSHKKGAGAGSRLSFDLDAPTVAKIHKQLQKAKRGKSKGACDASLDSTSRPVSERGVVYLGHIPHGFYEQQMRGFFSQFGTVERLRLSRNKKTGRSKHYAFIEFSDRDVARIVADCMENYLLFGRVLKCRLIDADKVHAKTFAGARRKFRAQPRHEIARARHNRSLTEKSATERADRARRRDSAKVERLVSAGVAYSILPKWGLSDEVGAALLFPRVIASCKKYLDIIVKAKRECLDDFVCMFCGYSDSSCCVRFAGQVIGDDTNKEPSTALRLETQQPAKRGEKTKKRATAAKTRQVNKRALAQKRGRAKRK